MLFWGFMLDVPAWIYLGIWIVMQVGWASLEGYEYTGTAWSAHIAGFVSGIVFSVLLKKYFKTRVPKQPY